MNLKYYLRGLGFGIIATALILGFHFSRTSKQMSDDEIKKRASQLGMIEANETLVSGDEEISAEDLLETIENESSDETDNTISQDGKGSTDSTDGTDTTGSADSTDGTDNTEQDVNSEPDTDEGEAEDLDAKITELEKTTEDIKTEIETVTDANDDPDRTTVEVTNNEESETVTLTIVSGDSSYGVAKKLVELGLVDDASDYDLYLCNNGYDRYIRTGTYTFSMDSTNLDIAKAITGK